HRFFRPGQLGVAADEHAGHSLGDLAGGAGAVAGGGLHAGLGTGGTPAAGTFGGAAFAVDAGAGRGGGVAAGGIMAAGADVAGAGLGNACGGGGAVADPAPSALAGAAAAVAAVPGLAGTTGAGPLQRRCARWRTGHAGAGTPAPSRTAVRYRSAFSERLRRRRGGDRAGTAGVVGATPGRAGGQPCRQRPFR